MGRRRGEPLIPDGCRLAIFTHHGKLYDALLLDYEDHELLVRSGKYGWKESRLGDAKIWELETWADWAAYGKCLRLRDEVEVEREKRSAMEELFASLPALVAMISPVWVYYAMQQMLGKAAP